MFGLHPAALSAAYILASMGQCAPPSWTQVDIDVQMEYAQSPPDDSLTVEQITSKFGNDTASTFAADSKAKIAGLTSSNYRWQMQEWFTAKRYGSGNDVCMFMKKVQYKIIYSPEVYIASDYKKIGCTYSVIATHEKRHTDADTQTITDYIPEIRSVIQNYFRNLPPQEAFDENDMKNQELRMMKAYRESVQESMKPIWDRLYQTRDQRQAAIDTPQNYKRDWALCPGLWAESQR